MTVRVYKKMNFKRKYGGLLECIQQKHDRNLPQFVLHEQKQYYKLVDNNFLLNWLHCAMIYAYTVDEAGSNPLSGANR